MSTIVQNYLEGYYTGDAPRMERNLHPHYLKHIIHGDIPMREKNGSQMLEAVRSEGKASLPQHGFRLASLRAAVDTPLWPGLLVSLLVQSCSLLILDARGRSIRAVACQCVGDKAVRVFAESK